MRRRAVVTVTAGAPASGRAAVALLVAAGVLGCWCGGGGAVARAPTADGPQAQQGSSSPAPACDAGYVLDQGSCEPVEVRAVQVADEGDGTVTVDDGVDRLVWTRDASCCGPTGRDQALDWTATLADGACGLSDGSVPGDWRLPTHVELMRLAAALASPAYQAAGSPFAGVATGGYWSSYSPHHDVAGVVEVYGGQYLDRSMDLAFDAWPVRRWTAPGSRP